MGGCCVSTLLSGEGRTIIKSALTKLNNRQHPAMNNVIHTYMYMYTLPSLASMCTERTIYVWLTVDAYIVLKWVQW